MSTRYVWGKYNKDRVFEEGVYYDDDAVVVWGYNESILDNPVIYWAQYSNYDISGNGKMSVSGLISNGTITSDNGYVDPYELEIGDNFATIFSSSPLNSDSVSGIITLYMNKSGSRTVQIVYSSVGNYSFFHHNHLGPGEYRYWGSYNDTKGSYISDVSGASQSSYPSDGVQGSYWYEYQGFDNIDPSSCTIPSSILGGQQIQIKVTPGTGKVYGGTVSYVYQVKLGSGNWTTVFTTTATSVNYTVPAGTASIQVRVQAKDNLGFTSSTYVTSSSVNVVNNRPPTAPGSINVSNVVSGQTATITLTAATDPDGTIASYIYERSVDGSAWTQIANVNSLTQTDTVSGDWGTVAYRAKAVDDDGASGPYVTSQTQVVNSGWVILSGPANDMGVQSVPFAFSVTPSISGETTQNQITVDITLDGKSIYSGAVNPGTAISEDIDTRVMRTGSHSIAVAASCAGFTPAAAEYTFTIPEITIPDGGRLDQLEAPDGQVVFPVTLARAVVGLENYGIESQVHPGAYTGSGTYGSGNPNSLTLEFEPKMVIVQGTSGRMAVMIKPSGVGISIGASDSTTLTVSWNGDTVSWYNGLNAANQMNTANETYSYTAFG